MEVSFSDKYTFLGEWYDKGQTMLRKYAVSYYPSNDTLDLIEIGGRKLVRRQKIDGISLDSFYIGHSLYILGKLIKIIDYACEHTRKQLENVIQGVFVVIHPIPTHEVGGIFKYFHDHGLRLTQARRTRMSKEDARFVISDLKSDDSYQILVEYLSSTDVYGIELVGRNAVARCQELVGNKDPFKSPPGTIRALYGKDPIHNAIYYSSTPEKSKENAQYFFPSKQMNRLRLTAILNNSTLCLIKPHAVKEGALGPVLQAITEAGFEVTALNMLVVEPVNAREFYEVYRGIVPEFMGMVEQLASGDCIALEVVAKDPCINTAVEFRKLVGPADPEVAKLLRPNTLRAKFGKHKVKNAIHCSDLPEDGALEVEYFFKILDI